MTGIVVGYLPNEVGRAALTHAVAMARRYGERLIVVNSSRGGTKIDTKLADTTHIAGLEAELEEAGVEFVIEQPARERTGAEEVLDAATTADASHIVIGLRRRTAVGKFVFGSNAQQILMQADCPVVSVKA